LFTNLMPDKKIPIGSTSESNLIRSTRRYRVQIEGRWYEGTFSKEWFGWKFNEYGSSGMQLNLIDQVIELDPAVPRGRKPRGGAAPSERKDSAPDEPE
jgi:hypothetical protein